MPQTIPIACNLEQAELPDRERVIESLGSSLVAVEAAGRRASLRFEAGRDLLDDFVRAESSCCPFFDFAVTDDGAIVTLEVDAPEGGEWAVRGLVAGFVAGWGGLV